MKPRIDPNKWYCDKCIPCIREAKAKNKICLYARGTKKLNGKMRCEKLEYEYTKYIQGFWILMKNPQNSENNT